MAGLSAWVVWSVSVLAAGGSYEHAYAQSRAKDRPLLVLVGAEWCPGCRTMKQRVMPRLREAGKLGRVEFAQVDADREPELAGKLMRGNSIPQLILFSRTADGWKRTQLTGAHGEGDVVNFVQNGVSSHVAENAYVVERKTGG